MIEASDAELVLGAQTGDAGCLGVLLQRHRAGMHAVALGVLGHRPEVEDVVQEACLIAVRQLGDLREPEAVGGWLRTVVRNQARMQVRVRRAEPTSDPEAQIPPVSDLDPARLLEQHALRDWVWQAVNLLSPDQRLVTMLRYFTSVRSYDQIAAVCGVPIGTVRSRLSHARARLTENLTLTADLAHDDQRALTAARRQEAQEFLAAGRSGRYAEAMAEFCVPSVEMTWAQGKQTFGFEYPAFAMHRDVGDGIVFRLSDVVAGPDVVIWETDLISPPDDPLHCPPGAVLVNHLTGGRATRIRLFHQLRSQPAVN